MSHSTRFPARLVTVLAALLAVLAGLLVGAPGAAASPGASPAMAPAAVPPGLPTAIEPLASYVEQVSCDPRARPGTVALARLLVATYRQGSWASTYACGTDGGHSEHYDGRAIDWMVDIHDRAQYAAARSAIAWLTATDRHGNADAMARRLGVMYVIYNSRMWGSWDGRWSEYNNCLRTLQRSYDNACHRTHMHISLGWSGAMGRTSYWSKQVAGTDYGPCRAADLNWAGRYRQARSTPCPDYPLVRSPSRASGVKQALVTWSGAGLGRGWRGPAVSAVQAAFHQPQTGLYDSALVAAVKAFQTRHHLTALGSLSGSTWRALLAATR